MKLKLIVLFIIICFSNNCFSQRSILFIGNSLTYVNDLPLVFNNICKINNKEFYTKMVAFPGYSLTNHLNSVIITTDNPNFVWRKYVSTNDTIVPDAILQLKSRKWDYIYLQDRSVDEDSIEYAVKQIRLLAPESKIIIFETYMGDSRWSKKYDKKKKKKNITNCNLLAKLINAEVILVGYCFEKIKKKYSYELLYDETMHPTIFGTTIIAVLMFKKIFPNTNIQLNQETINVTDEEWKILKQKVIKS